MPQFKKKLQFVSMGEEILDIYRITRQGRQFYPVQFLKSLYVFRTRTISGARMDQGGTGSEKARESFGFDTAETSRDKRAAVGRVKKNPEDQNGRGSHAEYTYCFPADRFRSEKGRVCVKLAFLPLVASSLAA